MTLHYPDDAAIARIGRSMLDLTLPKPEWTHAAHFACALWLMRRRPDLELSERMPGFIRAYNEAVGGRNTDTEGYHETITQASLRAARTVLNAHGPTAPLHAVLDALMATRLGDRDWMLAYWTRERLFSVEARRGWIEPDLGPMPY
jgi:hypothetical protein